MSSASTCCLPPSAYVTIPPVNDGEGPSFRTMIGLVALIVAAVILVFFAMGYGLGRILL